MKIKSAAYLGAWKVDGSRRSSRVVLMYHSVHTTPVLGHLTVTLDSFKRQLDYLQKHYVLGTIEDVYSDDESPRAAITFDDGYTHLMDDVVPVLIDRGINATFFVPTGLMGKQIETSYGSCDVMSESDVISLENSRFVIGSHSVSHAVLPECSIEELWTEVSGSKSKLEDMLGHPVPDFAYPKGRYNKAVIQAVRRAGHTRAVSVVAHSVGRDSDRLQIPRTGVYRGTSFNRFRFDLSPIGDRFSRFKKLGVQRFE